MHADSSGRFVLFSYSQTPGYPLLLDLENEKVYPIFSEKTELYHHAIAFLSWVSPDKMCVGFSDVDKTIAIISVADVVK